jgi:hypothetical protein
MSMVDVSDDEDASDSDSGAAVLNLTARYYSDNGAAVVNLTASNFDKEMFVVGRFGSE